MNMLGITLCWVKSHAGTLRNELEDTIAKKATTNESLTGDYNRIPKTVVTRKIEEESLKKWQRTRHKPPKEA